jgi:hypothetical protein
MNRDSNVRSRRNGNHRKGRLLPWCPQRRAFAGFGRATLAGVLGHSISIRRRFIGRLILLVAGLGIIFLASAVQTFGKNWLGQACPYPGPCFHVAWLAIGVGLSTAAYFARKVVNSSRY